jgi:hypothetical protein
MRHTRDQLEHGRAQRWRLNGAQEGLGSPDGAEKIALALTRFHRLRRLRLPWLTVVRPYARATPG